MFLQKLSSLEIVWQFFPGGISYNPWASKTYQGTRLRDVDVAKHGK